MFAVFNLETGDFYSESPALQNEAQLTGSIWNNTSLLPSFARRYMSFKEAVRRAQKLFNKTGGDWHAVLLTDLG